jgi:GDP-4-dehydro-6-deoxy-D-mannose reductase
MTAKTTQPERSLKNKRILITGIAGFGGSWLAETILQNEKGAELFGLKRSTTSTENINHIIDKMQLFDADITDYDAVNRAVKEINPNVVFHLASVVSSIKAIEDPVRTMKTNVDGTRNLLNALTKGAQDLETFHFTSTSAIYKTTKEDISVKENHQLEAHDPYSKSKIEAEKICNEFLEKEETPVIITRAFNQGGPRCLEDIVANKIARIAVSAKKEGKREFVFGNIDAIRDFTDVRDIVNGYWLIAKKGRVGEVYNLCSGKGIKIKDLIDMALSYVDLKNKVKIIADQKLFRKGEQDILIGDNTKARKNLGWKPKIPFEQTLKEMIDYYLSQS